MLECASCRMLVHPATLTNTQPDERFGVADQILAYQDEIPKRKCKQCGVEFEASKFSNHTKQFCCQSHGKEYRRQHSGLSVHICQGCGIEFIPRGADRTKYCSRECAFNSKGKVSSIKSMIEKLKRIRECKVCGKRSFRVICSVECGREYEKRCSRNRKRNISDKDVFRCYQCGKEFKPEYGDRHRKFCSVGCGERFGHKQAKRRRRARRWKTEHIFDKFSDWQIFERDKWICMICGLPVRCDVQGNHNQAPTIDHIVPFAKGGTHTRGNVQCSHRICNSIKSDKPMREALQLIAS